MSVLFSLRPLILDRLRSVVPPTLQVAALPSLEALLYGPPAPGVYLLYGGAKITSHRPDGRGVWFTQTWRVVVVARHLATAPGALAAADDAATLADTVLDACLGWRPAGAASPLRAVDFPALDLGEATVEVMAVAFEVEAHAFYSPLP